MISITREIKAKLSMKSENDTIIDICEVREVSMRTGTRPRKIAFRVYRHRRTGISGGPNSVNKDRRAQKHGTCLHNSEY